MESYELPNIRCMTCNNPIAHLLEEYHLLKKSGVEMSIIFDQLHLPRYCCRKELSFPPKYTYDTYKLPYNFIYVDNITKPEVFYSSERQIYPISMKEGNKRRKINNDLYISYSGKTVYTTQ